MARAIYFRRGSLIAGVALLVIFGALLAHLLTDSRQRAQMQRDPKVATVWIIGVTHGSHQTLTRGTLLQQWLNAHDIHALGDYSSLQSRFSGDPGGIELWFDYESYLPGHPNMECHRTGETAFVDDLGQPYHGYLDFQGKYLGVYLPGYDHAAHRLICTVRWMPRWPIPPRPVSTPMVFTVDLPPARRVLPSAASLPHGPVSAAKQGITVTASDATLSASKLTTLQSGQRDLTFRLKVEGGEIANFNVESDAPIANPFAFMNGRSFRSLSSLRIYLRTGSGRYVPRTNTVAPVSRPFVISDPYGISLLQAGSGLSPMLTLTMTHILRDKNGTAWIAPVTGAGRGTDAVRLRFEVRPATPATSAKATNPPPTVPFDLVIPVRTGDEI